MAIADRWILPDGVDEILPPQAERIETMRRQLLDQFNLWGFQLVIPPMAEYQESLFTGVGHDLDLVTYKLIDQQNGRTMGLSADLTQQVARMDAHSIPTEQVARYCYAAPLLHTKAASLQESRSPIQVGAEIYGCDNLSSDIEIISLMLSVLEKSNIEDVTLDLGHVGVYRALSKEADLSSQQEQELFALLRARGLPEIKSWLEKAEISAQARQWFNVLSQASGNADQLGALIQKFDNAPQAVLDAINVMEQTFTAIKSRFSNIQLHFDLAELNDWNYHTGLVFSAFVPQFGQAVAKGGRYDATGEVFGRARAATGFSTDIKVLALLSQSGVENELDVVYAPVDLDSKGWQKVQALRDQGVCVKTDLNNERVGDQLQLVDGSWQVVKAK